MPKFTRVLERPSPLGGNQILGWYSQTRRGFIVGNHSDKMLVPVDPRLPSSMLVKHADPYAQKLHAYDDMLEGSDYEDLAHRGRDGFQFLSREQFDSAFAGQKWGSCCPVDQVISSGLTQELPVLHPASGAIVSFANKRISLHAKTPALEKIGEVKTRGAMTEAMLAAPRSDFIYYADHTGDFVQVPVSSETIGPKKKLATFDKGVLAIRAAVDGPHLYVGGVGLLAVVEPIDGKLKILAWREVACRSLEVLSDRWLIVNGGMHGFTLYDNSAGQLRTEVTEKPPAVTDRMIVSPDGKHLLAISKPPVVLTVYAISLQD